MHYSQPRQECVASSIPNTFQMRNSWPKITLTVTLWGSWARCKPVAWMKPKVLSMSHILGFSETHLSRGVAGTLELWLTGDLCTQSHFIQWSFLQPHWTLVSQTSHSPPHFRALVRTIPPAWTLLLSPSHQGNLFQMQLRRHFFTKVLSVGPTSMKTPRGQRPRLFCLLLYPNA